MSYMSMEKGKLKKS